MSSDTFGTRSLYGLPAVFKSGYWIVFSPDFSNLARIPADRIDLPETLDELKKSGFLIPFNSKEKSNILHVTLIVTNECNLRCKYCFANSGAEQVIDKKIMSLKIATAALQYAAEIAKGRKLSVSFFGGEPTVQFGLIKEIVAVAIKISQQHDLPNPEFSVTTNGIFGSLIMDYLIENKFQITLSADGAVDIQDFQRPAINGSSSKIVEQTIRRFVSRNHPFKVRATVTAFSVHKMADSVTWLANLGGSEIQFEPVSIAGRARLYCEEVGKPPVDAFIDGLKKAIIRGCETGVGVSHSSFMNLTNTPFSFCDGNCANRFAVTYNGDITRCVEVQDRCHPAANLFLLGKYDEETDRIVISSDKKEPCFGKKPIGLHSGGGNKCSTCFASRICGGGCPIRNFHVNNNVNIVDEYRCKITKEIIPFIYEMIDDASQIS